MSRSDIQEVKEQWRRATVTLWQDLQVKECITLLKEVEEAKIKELWLRVREVVHGQKSWQQCCQVGLLYQTFV